MKEGTRLDVRELLKAAENLVAADMTELTPASAIDFNHLTKIVNAKLDAARLLDRIRDAMRLI